jgi:DNA-binding transcriptional regulator YdaS (Cro superfamily)
MTETQARTLLRQKVKHMGSQAALARACGVSPMYLSDVLKGRRPVGPKLLKAIGYEVVREIRAIA